MAEIKKDDVGFYYFEHTIKEKGYRIVLFRSEDIANIIQIESNETALEHHYVDLHDAVMLAMTNGKEDFGIYLNSVFEGDHMHPDTEGAPLPRLLTNELEKTDRMWSDLITK